MKEMTMLDLSAIDLSVLCTALEDHSYEHRWWIDPQTGEIGLWSPYVDELETEDELDARGVLAIDAIESSEAYGDLQDFTARVSDPRARALLERAIAGRGAFRRFKDTLFDFEDLRQAWFAFHDSRMRRRAIEWLSDAKLVDEAQAEHALAECPDPDLPEISGPFDAFEIARAVALDLKQLYGDRLKQVILFGSWARGDAQRDSDIDLLVVLDHVGSRWRERELMDEIMWRHSLSNTTVVTGFPVSEEDFVAGRLSLLVNAAKEGRRVA